ncbi:hypothetical protein [Mucilaginibacter ginsenosidivorax]|uniref:Uncharacterized protein n=1 Tax=Mucilaginibacter ginsenosidivorax TaxID=862126 RepID=A0A5B8W6R3_9SPHI|nr:hypothetical protein [Mucilaginibacter ginsenosidivorax]QEC79299.1 hypothetical protein FSB76_26360 [Mucilaginibacter ginsenosidivorax]
MNTKTKGIFFILFFLIAIIVIFIIVFNLQSNRSDQVDKDRLALTGNVQFKGKVIKSKIYEYAGKNYYMICIQLDTCNVKKFYVFNERSALKIKNNIATISAGVFVPYYGVVNYVEVNIKNNKKIKFFYKTGDIHEYELNLANNGLSENDMNLCD